MSGVRKRKTGVREHITEAGAISWWEWLAAAMQIVEQSGFIAVTPLEKQRDAGKKRSPNIMIRDSDYG